MTSAALIRRRRRALSIGAIPANAIRDRAGNPILSRSGDYIVTRA